MSEKAVSLSDCIKHKAMNEVLMARYSCHKEVHALPLTRGVYNKVRDWIIPDNENPDDAGYLVVYNRGTADEYVSWSPKHVFDDGYLHASDIGSISDGYHTFNELYDHRHALFINLLNSNLDKSFKTLLNDRLESMDGWFIAGMDTDAGQVTYHLPIQYWNEIKAEKIEANINYDGHSSSDVLERLIKLANK